MACTRAVLYKMTMPQDYATILCLQGHSQPYSKGISLQKWGSVGAKNCIVTKWPLCKGLKLSLCVEEISTGMEKPLVRRAHDLLRVAAYGQLDGATVKINVKQGLELESFPSSGGFGHGDFKRTLKSLDWQHRLLFHGTMLLGFTI